MNRNIKSIHNAKRSTLFISAQKTKYRSWLHLFFLGAYCLVGIYGHVYFIDDFVTERLLVLSYFGVPVTTMFYFLWAFFPHFLQIRPRLNILLIGLILLIYLPGYFLGLNSLGHSQEPIKRTVSVQGQIAIRDVERGSLGILYTKRW